ncbi:MAG TPA: hypothetical protein VES20_25375 [Bryobacteraceae bacterium]|nr:hypothetical protein [Bryobacteraceae bacterium]
MTIENGTVVYDTVCKITPIVRQPAAVPSAILFVAALAVACDSRLPSPDEWMIPQPIRRQVARELRTGYRVVAHLNPFYLRGNLNGDARSDYVLLIEEKSSCKIGVAVFLTKASGYTLHILGAGKPLPSASSIGDDFSFVDAWQIHEKGPVSPGATNAVPPRFSGDAVLVEKTESASGLIYWTGRTFGWYQQGD